jgi:DNA-binding NarL/FixJ family response regulator
VRRKSEVYRQEEIDEMARQQPTEPGPKPLGLVWIKCAYPVLFLGLKEVLESEADVHLGLKPPADRPPSSIVLCLDREDTASELKHLQTLDFDASIFILSLRADPQLAASALEEGASGFVNIEMEPSQIVHTLSLTSEGEVVVPRELVEDLVNEKPRKDLSLLTDQQLSILELVAEGMRNRDIAGRLFLSEHTVKQYLYTAYRALGVSNRTQATKLFEEWRSHQE